MRSSQGLILVLSLHSPAEKEEYHKKPVQRVCPACRAAGNPLNMSHALPFEPPCIMSCVHFGHYHKEQMYNIYVKIGDKVVPAHAMKAYRGAQV
jgi:hypothetical protein